MALTRFEWDCGQLGPPLRRDVDHLLGLLVRSGLVSLLRDPLDEGDEEVPMYGHEDVEEVLSVR